jgi:NADH/NAD ratio-sensing transcriptional regulator Rex
MSQFILKINFGNDAMINADNIGEALVHYGKKIRSTGRFDIGTIHDQNGNTVGQYYTDEE